jgi:hypothetical protein
MNCCCHLWVQCGMYIWLGLHDCVLVIRSVEWFVEWPRLDVSPPLVGLLSSATSAYFKAYSSVGHQHAMHTIAEIQ